MKTMKIMNPATGQLIREVQTDSPSSIENKLKAARAAQPAWAKKTLKERIAIIQKFHDLLDQKKETLTRDLTSEVGKPIQESRNEINGARYRISFFLENSEKWLTENKVNQQGNTEERIAFEPLGVVCNISAWNYPFLVGVNVFIPALIAGNAVVYKPSEFATLTGLNIEKLMHDMSYSKKLHDIEVAIPL
jgi:acyl-CoA reductase-like NAD-dependent aldehyde dehydrogenase